ncbi:MAG TPA: nucleotidyltransferase family protein [Ramlibacter sp.]|uniref:nucleotidyltransferase family protein n=1 Tax=Ramlibacter sp. TaxID=1917967 RepID=UPI002ED020CC
MRPSEVLAQHRGRVRQIALRHGVRDVRVFGSIARGEDTEGSDLDLLVEPTEATTLLDIGAIQQELTQLLGVDVDIVTPNAFPEAHRSRILEESAQL